jgi:hypothetical protein
MNHNYWSYNYWSGYWSFRYWPITTVIEAAVWHLIKRFEVIVRQSLDYEVER